MGALPLRAAVVDAPAAADAPFTEPVADAFTEPWWAACRNHRLMVRACRSCGEVHFPPRPACPRCWSADVEWREVTGAGRIYTYSVVRENDLAAFRGALPYIVAIVELDEGPRLMTTLVDSPAATIVVGAAVQVVFADRGEWTFPAFRTV